MDFTTGFICAIVSVYVCRKYFFVQKEETGVCGYWCKVLDTMMLFDACPQIGELLVLDGTLYEITGITWTVANTKFFQQLKLKVIVSC